MTRVMSRSIEAARAILLAALVLAACPSPAPAQTTGIGPFAIQTPRGRFNARLLRKDKATLWVMRESADGGQFEAGVPLAEITRIEVPTPRMFAFAEQATSQEQIRAAHDGLDRIIAMLKPFRELPGVNVDEAVLRKGQLYDRQGLWREAVHHYEEIVKLPYPSDQKPAAQLRAGIALELAGEHESALKYLLDAQIPEDDEVLLSSAIFARASALAAADRNTEAIMDYLRLVVFHPYVQNNEARGLEAVLPCYAKLKDWESMLKTIVYLRQEHAGTPETRRAEETFAQYRKELEAAGQFVDGAAAPAQPKAPDAEPGTAAATPAAATDAETPAPATPAPAQTNEEATIEDVEVD